MVEVCGIIGSVLGVWALRNLPKDECDARSAGKGEGLKRPRSDSIRSAVLTIEARG